MTQEKFIEKAKKVHGDKYDYFKIVYKGCNNEVIVIDKNTKEEKTVKPKYFLNNKSNYIRITKYEYDLDYSLIQLGTSLLLIVIFL